MKMKFKQWSSILPITKRTIISHLNSLNTKTTTTIYYVGNPGLGQAQERWRG